MVSYRKYVGIIQRYTEMVKKHSTGRNVQILHFWTIFLLLSHVLLTYLKDVCFSFYISPQPTLNLFIFLFKLVEENVTII